MSQSELLKCVSSVLEREGIPFMLTGSYVSSLQGEPRASQDIDLVVQIAPSAAPALANAFPPPDYYLDEHAIRDAIASQGMFNLLDATGGDKVDFWILTDEGFDQSRFARRAIEDVEGMKIAVSRPEDTILMKLRWCEMSGGSEKQFGDALRVYEVQVAKLDQGYMDRWAAHLGVAELVASLRTAAREG